MLAKPAKKGYTYPSGADLIRCVGGLITCAGTGERQLPCTAVISLFSYSYYTIRTSVRQWFSGEKYGKLPDNL